MKSLTRVTSWLRPRRLLSFGLLGQISLALLVVGLVPLATASFRLIATNREAMTTQVLQTHAVAAKTTAKRVEGFVEARRYVARAAAANAELARDPHSPAAAQILSELLRSALGVAAVSVRTAEGEEVIRAQRRDSAAAVAQVLARSPGPEMSVAQGGGLPWLRLDVPLASSPGVLQVVFELAPLERDLRPRELGRDADLVMVDQRGTLVSGSGDLATYPREMMAAALSGRVSGSGRFAGPNAATLGAYAPVAGTPWIVLSRQPARVAEATARTLQRRSAYSVAVAAVLVLGLTTVARRTIVGPLRTLIQAHSRLAGTSDAVRGGSEIDQLKAGFALLERRLRDREALGEVFLGRYRIVSVVGEGAMGTVFRGWDPALKRSVALKTVRFDRWVDAERGELAARLLDEAVTVARFNHPNIVGLYDVQESPEVAFLAMEFVDGTSLDHYIAARGRLTESEAVAVGLAMARGLAAAHGRNVVHHDIKPANVLLGHDGAIKVVDFGISQVISSLAEEPGVLFGTPGFIPPEALRGEPFGPSGDLFALGVTLYQMLTGDLPFWGKTVQETLTRTLDAPAVLSPETAATLPPELVELVASLLEKDPQRRCPSAREAVCRLEALARAPDLAHTSSFTLEEPELELMGTERLAASQLVSRAQREVSTAQGATLGTLRRL